MSSDGELKTLNLAARANQERFAVLVGTSQPAISAHLRKGHLTKGGSYRTWLSQYCDQLRKEASGRSGDKQAELTEARIAESKENTATKQQSRLREAGKLLQLDDALLIINELPRLVASEFNRVGIEIQESLQVKHGIKIEDGDVIEPIRVALGLAGDRALKLSKRLEGNTD